jgi:hypothetical protein
MQTAGTSAAPDEGVGVDVGVSVSVSVSVSASASASASVGMVGLIDDPVQLALLPRPRMSTHEVDCSTLLLRFPLLRILLMRIPLKWIPLKWISSR